MATPNKVKQAKKSDSDATAMKHGDHAHPNQEMMMIMPNSFADMLKFQPELRERLKLPDWLLFPTTYARQDQAKLSKAEQQRFLCAFNVLKDNSTLGALVDIHGDPTHQPHTTQRFLPWHRVYLIQLEQALRSIHPDVAIPYWDWTQASEQSIPTWLNSVLPTVVTPTQTINVTRFPQSPASLATIASNTPNTLAQVDFTNFTSLLQGIHNSVHVWVGGSMGSVPTASADPIFWMHHCNIDRLWHVWQTMPGNAGKSPVLAGAAAVMDPWAVTEADTRNIEDLGYHYA